MIIESMMDSNDARCAEHRKFKLIDAAFRAGDLAALRAAVDDPANIPNGTMPMTIGRCLEYAIYHSPLPFIRTQLFAVMLMRLVMKLLWKVLG